MVAGKSSRAHDDQRWGKAVIADYERRGYDFLSISDHDRLVSPETYQKGTNLSLIRGVEVTAEGPHILHVNAHDTVEPVRDRQKVLDGIQRGGGFSVLCHPNLGPRCDHFQQRSMETLEGFVGIEIYNGVVERCGGRALATDRWDILLSSGRRIWGFADDDSHRPGDVGLAWNVVQSENRSTEAIITAIRQGRFYSLHRGDDSERSCRGRRDPRSNRGCVPDPICERVRRHTGLRRQPGCDLPRTGGQGFGPEPSVYPR